MWIDCLLQMLAWLYCHFNLSILTVVQISIFTRRCEKAFKNQIIVKMLVYVISQKGDPVKKLLVVLLCLSLTAFADEKSAPSAPVAAAQDAGNSAQTGKQYVNRDGQAVPSPAKTSSGQPPAGATAQCADGSFSFSAHRQGTCSHHGGVAAWLPR